MEQFDTLYSISDLHLGGRPGFQMVHPAEAKRLADSIVALTDREDDGETVLVLNGDIIDTLAESRGTLQYLHVDDAIAVLTRISGVDPETGLESNFKRVFDALGTFASKPRHRVIIAIGNHDLELSFPHVQDWLRKRFGAAARVEFTPPGQPMLFEVGGRRVFVTHGNEVDEWNVVDLDQLNWAIDRQLRGFAFDPEHWVPNAGTSLVVAVMNELKSRHPFVDLLKPEIELAVPILAAIDYTALAKVRRVGEAAATASRTQPRRLGVDDLPRHAPQPDLLRTAIDSATPKTRADDYLNIIDEQKLKGEVPSASTGTLDFTMKSAWYALTGNLKNALRDWLTGAFAFGETVLLDYDKRVIARIGPGIDVVIAGHSHLPRSVVPQWRQLIYLNTGTWARVMELTHADLDSADWPAIEAALKDNSMQALDGLARTDGSSVVRTQGVVAVVAKVGTKVEAWLWEPAKEGGRDVALLGGRHTVGDAK